MTLDCLDTDLMESVAFRTVESTGIEDVLATEPDFCTTITGEEVINDFSDTTLATVDSSTDDADSMMVLDSCKTTTFLREEVLLACIGLELVAKIIIGADDEVVLVMSLDSCTTMEVCENLENNCEEILDSGDDDSLVTN